MTTSGNGVPQVAGILLDEQTVMTLAEVCRACAAHEDRIVELVEEGVLAPQGRSPAQWRFTGMQLRHATIAVRLQSDLGVNPAGAALALQLLEEVEALRTRLRALGGD